MLLFRDILTGKYDTPAVRNVSVPLRTLSSNESHSFNVKPVNVFNLGQTMVNRPKVAYCPTNKLGIYVMLAGSAAVFRRIQSVA